METKNKILLNIESYEQAHSHYVATLRPYYLGVDTDTFNRLTPVAVLRGGAVQVENCPQMYMDPGCTHSLQSLMLRTASGNWVLHQALVMPNLDTIKLLATAADTQQGVFVTGPLLSSASECSTEAQRENVAIPVVRAAGGSSHSTVVKFFILKEDAAAYLKDFKESHAVRVSDTIFQGAAATAPERVKTLIRIRASKTLITTYPKGLGATHEPTPLKSDLISQGKGYSFGCEIETASSSTRHLLTGMYKLRSDVDLVRDGSITGPEYVTTVLKGDEGFLSLRETCEFIENGSVVDVKCGTHVHIGNVNYNMEKAVKLFLTANAVEKSVFSMFGGDRRANRYCRPMPTLLGLQDLQKAARKGIKQNPENAGVIYEAFIESAFSLLYSCLVGTNVPSSQRRQKVLTKYSDARYSWVNMLGALCNYKGRCSDMDSIKQNSTAEFRILEGVTDYNILKNWVLICMGIVSYSEKVNPIACVSPIEIEEVIKSTYIGSRQSEILDFIQQRKQFFATNTTCESWRFSNSYVPYTKQEKKCV